MHFTSLCDMLPPDMLEKTEQSRKTNAKAINAQKKY
jgi:hypothetical protein